MVTLTWPAFLSSSSLSFISSSSSYQYTPLPLSLSPTATTATTMNKQSQVTVVPAENKTNKFKSFFKRDKKAPTVLSERDARVLARVKSRAKLLDTGLNIGCARVGIDPIIGLVPVAGDLVTMLLALQLIHMAQEAEIPKSLSYRMLLNVVFDFGIGLVPVLGDYADFLFKANARNAKHFEEFLYERAAKDEAKLEATTFAENNVTAPQSAAGPSTGHGGYRNQSRTYHV